MPLEFRPVEIVVVDSGRDEFVIQLAEGHMKMGGSSLKHQASLLPNLCSLQRILRLRVCHGRVSYGPAQYVDRHFLRSAVAEKDFMAVQPWQLESLVACQQMIKVE